MEEKTMKFTQVCDMFRHGRLYYRSYEEVVKLDSQEILTGESLCYWINFLFIKTERMKMM